MTPAELQALTPNFDWARYFRGIGAPPITAINVSEPEFFKAFDQLLAHDAARRLQAYLRWHLVHANAAAPVEGVRRRELPLLQRNAAGRAGAAAALEALRQLRRRRPRRGARPGVREGSVRPAGEEPTC